MCSSDSSAVELHGNGEKVHLENKHCLWTPRKTDESKEPLWHLRVQVLKDHEGRGDAPGRIFAFKSLHHLNHAASQLEAAFSDIYDIRMKKCGVETPNAMGDRVNDGRCENITIEFDSETATQGWEQFLEKLKHLEDEWANEGHHDGQSVL